MSKLIYSLSPSYNLQSEFKCNFYNICHLDSFILNFHFFFNSNLNLTRTKIIANKGNNKITELRTILQRESQNS